jgi:hypothetical protein
VENEWNGATKLKIKRKTHPQKKSRRQMLGPKKKEMKENRTKLG